MFAKNVQHKTVVLAKMIKVDSVKNVSQAFILMSNSAESALIGLLIFRGILLVWNVKVR
jgi:hypothetical protein